MAPGRLVALRKIQAWKTEVRARQCWSLGLMAQISRTQEPVKHVAALFGRLVAA